MNVFKFYEYKPFLTDYISQQPRKGRGLMKAIAEHLNLDPSQVSQVISGSKDFTEEQAIHLTLFLGLNELESDYFMSLVKTERAGSKLLRTHYQKKSEELRTRALDLKERVNQDRILTDQEKSVFYSSFLYSAIRLFSSIENGKTLGDVIERFDLPRERAALILRFLTETGLCKEENGVYSLGTQHTHVERGSPHLNKHHQNWRVKALESVEWMNDEELQFTSPASLSKKDFLAVREILVGAVQNLWLS